MGLILRDAESRLSGLREKRQGRHAEYIFNVEQHDNLTLPAKDSPGNPGKKCNAFKYLIFVDLITLLT